MELQAGQHESFDTFFLAMANWQLGKKVEARAYYDRAVEWMDKHPPASANLRRFRSEAAVLLKIDDTKKEESK
jgi:hypothetical protein